MSVSKDSPQSADATRTLPTAAQVTHAVRRGSEIRREECRRWVEELFTSARMVDDYLRR